MRIACLLVTVVMCASGCTLLTGPDGDAAGDIVFTSDRAEYARGDTARITLRNTTDHLVGYNLCLSARDLRTPTGWSRIFPLRLCTADLRTLQPGAIATLVEVITDEWGDDQYRMVTSIEFLGRGAPQEILSSTFIVRE